MYTSSKNKTTKQDRLRAESDGLEDAPFNVKKKRIEKVENTIKEYLAAKRLDGSRVIDAITFDLLDCNFDIESAVWSLESDAISLLKALTSPKVIEAIDPNIMERSIDLLYRLNRFAAGLKDDYRTAELQLTFVEYDGEGHIYNSLSVENDYLLKLKMLELESEFA